MPRKPRQPLASVPAAPSLYRRAARALEGSDPALAAELEKAALAEDKAAHAAAKGLNPARFLAIVTPLMPTLALPVPEMRTKAWYSKLGALLKRSGLTEELAAELARKVASWSTQDMPVEMLVTRASQYLSQREGREGVTLAQPGSVGPRPMFSDEESQDGDA